MYLPEVKRQFWAFQTSSNDSFIPLENGPQAWKKEWNPAFFVLGFG